MIGLLFFFFKISYSCKDQEIDELIVKPSFLSDFVNAHQLRNLTLLGHNNLAPINGQYFTKPMFELQPTLQPTFLTLRSLHFTQFDGMITRGEAHGIDRFADFMVYECQFTDGFGSVININGPPDHL